MAVDNHIQQGSHVILYVPDIQIQIQIQVYWYKVTRSDYHHGILIFNCVPPPQKKTATQQQQQLIKGFMCANFKKYKIGPFAKKWALISALSLNQESNLTVEIISAQFCKIKIQNMNRALQWALYSGNRKCRIGVLCLVSGLFSPTRLTISFSLSSL